MSKESKTDLNLNDDQLDNEQDCELCNTTFIAKDHNFLDYDDIYVCNECLKDND